VSTAENTAEAITSQARVPEPDGLIDLRSDTVTKPSAAMRAAMVEAPVGDDAYGEDPTVRRLESRIAELFGFECALFTPSGVMANNIGIRLLVGPGEELLCDADAHVVAHEGAGIAWHGAIQTRTMVNPRGLLDPATLRAVIRRGDDHTVGTRAVEIEQTHNRGGGSVYPIETLRELRRVADEAGVAVHCDGARIWNAHVATGVPLSEYGAIADTLSVCLSKGLGAPVGSVLLFPAEQQRKARAMRHRLGGSMRQAGLLAAAGLYALDHNIERMVTDHANARLLADGLRAAGFNVREPETNIVLIDVDDADKLVARCAQHGVLVTEFGPTLVRLVTHLDVDHAACERAVEAVAAAARV
jgi:threonine aldolase